MLHRRDFLSAAGAALGSTVALGNNFFLRPAFADPRPKLQFYASTQQVSGSCHILETSKGLFVVDCGLFYNDIDNPDKENAEFPFDPKEVKALILTHGHVDHNGRLPLLYEKGFRGPIYCTDVTRDISEVMLKMSAAMEKDEPDPLYKEESVEPTIKAMQAVPYNTRFVKSGLEMRYTDAGHILGSAMVEVWVDGVKILFGGDMGPDYSPILCKPTQHFGADAVLVESTYGPTPRDTVSYEDFGRKIMKVIKGGGSVLIPAFALHKTQTIIYILHKLALDKVIDPNIPIYSDSSTAHKCTEIYERYKEYHDPDARAMKKLFYQKSYRETRGDESLATHGKEPAIYISTSGMLDHAMAPKHLAKMASDPKNAVFIVGYQAPNSVGKKLLSGDKEIAIPIEERDEKGNWKRKKVTSEIKLSVEKIGGFSSHARGQQILEWVSEFRSIGDLYVVHGDAERATGLADAAKQMGVNATAPKRGDTFEVGKSNRVKPGKPPKLEAEAKPAEPPPVDK